VSDAQVNHLTPVLLVTDAARAFIVNERNEEQSQDELALYIEINGTNDGVYTYDMWFEVVADAASDDAIEHHDELNVVVLGKSVANMVGATLDLGDEGLFIVNPNVPTPERSTTSSIDIPESDLSSPVERAVLYVLDHDVNPQIAMHGGRADLVAVAEGIAFLRLSGGCQGCGLASVTLSQGISVAIKDAVPEIVDIVDVTEHEFGENPYFEGAKK
jgi:Fe/S biogenesis protein NfuA